MDMWKYFAITHEDHTVMNPLSLGKTREVLDMLRLEEGDRVLDLACGKAEFLCMAVERYRVQGTGVDASPYTSEEARRNVQSRGLTERIDILHMDAAAYEPDAPEGFALSSCIGGSWIFQGHKGTLEALTGITRQGGLVLVGEPFWKEEPSAEYLQRTGYAREQMGTHEGNVKTGVELGLSFLYSTVSNEDDWDRYEGLQWQAAERHAAKHPEDPDVEEVLETVRRNRDAYLRWGRRCMSWAMYLFCKP